MASLTHPNSFSIYFIEYIAIGIWDNPYATFCTINTLHISPPKTKVASTQTEKQTATNQHEYSQK